MSYSSNTDISNLVDVVEFDFSWEFSAVTFYGSGLNDMTLSAAANQGKTNLDEPQSIVVEIINIDGAADVYRVSRDDGVEWGSIGAIPASLISDDIGFGIRVDWGAVTGHTKGNFWKFTATPITPSAYRDFAYDWLNDSLEQTHDVPFDDPSKTIILTEATYAIYLILRKADDPRYTAFRAEAYRLLALLADFRSPAEREVSVPTEQPGIREPVRVYKRRTGGRRAQSIEGK